MTGTFPLVLAGTVLLPVLGLAWPHRPANSVPIVAVQGLAVAAVAAALAWQRQDGVTALAAVVALAALAGGLPRALHRAIDGTGATSPSRTTAAAVLIVLAAIVASVAAPPPLRPDLAVALATLALGGLVLASGRDAASLGAGLATTANALVFSALLFLPPVPALVAAVAVPAVTYGFGKLLRRLEPPR